MLSVPYFGEWRHALKGFSYYPGLKAFSAELNLSVIVSSASLVKAIYAML
jgi:hypothetical protein